MDEEFGEWNDYTYSDDTEFMQTAWKAITRINKDTSDNSPPINNRLVPLKVLSVKYRKGNGINYESDILMGHTVQKLDISDANKIGITLAYDVDDNGELSIWRVRAWIESDPDKRLTIQWIEKLRDVKMTRNKSYKPYSTYDRHSEIDKPATTPKSNDFLTPKDKNLLLPCNDYMGKNEPPKGYRKQKNFKFTEFIVHDPETPNMCVWKSARRLNKEGSRTGQYIWIPIKIVSIRAQRVQRDLYTMEILFAESTALKKDVDIRSVGPHMKLQQKSNARKMLYYVQVWMWIDQCLLTRFYKIRDVSPEENL